MDDAELWVFLALCDPALHTAHVPVDAVPADFLCEAPDIFEGFDAEELGVADGVLVAGGFWFEFARWEAEVELARVVAVSRDASSSCP